MPRAVIIYIKIIAHHFLSFLGFRTIEELHTGYYTIRGKKFFRSTISTGIPIMQLSSFEAVEQARDESQAFFKSHEEDINRAVESVLALITLITLITSPEWAQE